MSNSTPTYKVGPPLEELPGATVRYSSPWQEVAEKCRETPGKWRHVALDGYQPVTKRTAAGRISGGILVAFREGDWDAATRNRELYVRYLGEFSA